MTGPPFATPPVRPRRPFALLVLGAAAFTVYGSLVPFEFRPRPLADAADAFGGAMTHRLRVESRSDGLANVLLGVPLGFGLLGLCRVGAADRAGDWGVAAALLPGCLAFAAAVEFAQLYVPTRYCAGSDVLCQGVGAALGMVGWVAAGRWLTGHAAAVWYGSRVGGTAGRVLVGYLTLLAFVQLLPMDLSASPRDLYHKLRDVVVFVPFSEFLDADTDTTWSRAATLLQVFGLYAPVGLLAAGLPGRFWRTLPLDRVAAVAVALACGLEALQLIVHSRVPSATDVVVGAGGVAAGWGVRRWGDGGRLTSTLLGAVWLGVLAVVSWQPFTPWFRDPPRPFDWIPGLPLESGNPLLALGEMLTKVVLFALGGVAVAGVEGNGSGRGRLVAAAAVGLAASAVCEAGQTVIAARTPCITDVLLGGAGALAGAWAAGRCRLP